MKKNFLLPCTALMILALSFMPCGAVFADDELAGSLDAGTWVTNPRYLTFGSYS
jgi:hypothetical protein